MKTDFEVRPIFINDDQGFGWIWALYCNGVECARSTNYFFPSEGKAKDHAWRVLSGSVSIPDEKLGRYFMEGRDMRKK